MWPAYWSTLQQLPTSTTFFVSTTTDKEAAVKQLVQKDNSNAMIFAFENKGRDFGALMSLMQQVQLSSFDLVLKLHTGNTDFYSDIPNERWLLELIRSLIPSGRLNYVLDFFQKNPNVGLAGPSGHHWPLKKLFYNETTVNYWNKLTAVRKQSDFPENPTFIAGGMFWARGSIFKGFADLQLSQSQFEEDGPAVDGTLCHTLERMVSLIAHDQSLRVEGFDFSDFSQWLSQRTMTESQRHQIENFISTSRYQPAIQIIVRCSTNFEPDSLKLSLQSIQSATTCGMKVLATVWEEAKDVDLASLTNAIIHKSQCDYLLIIQAGDELTACGLLMAYIEMIQHPASHALYADKMLRAPGGSIETAFLPEFNHDLLVSFPWLMSNHWFFKRESLQHLGGFDASAGRFIELAFILKLLATSGPKLVHHVAEPLLITPEPTEWLEEPEERALVENYIVSTGYPNGQVLQQSPRLYRALYLLAESPLVSIIVPNQGLHQTQRCMESLLQNTGYSHYEILIVDNHSKDAASVSWLEGIGDIDPQRFRIVYNDGLSNIYAMNNAGAKAAKGELLVFVDSSVQFIEQSWLDALVIHGQRPQVGAVGVKLVNSDLKIVSAGIVLGMKYGNENTYVGERFDDIGYLQRLSVDQSYSAVSSRCIMVRSTLFESVGGFQENLNKNTETDIDFCLKLKAQDLDNIWTPHAVVQWSPPIAAIKNAPSLDSAHSDKFLRTWLLTLANDPAYNKNLSLIAQPYSVEPMQELSWRPLSWRPSPVVLAHPSDDTGCGQYRVIQPLNAMMNEGMADGVISFRHLVPAQLERIQPDTIIFQRPLAREFLDFMNHSKTYSNAFKVYEIDDLITNIPIKNYFKSRHPKDTVKLLREGIAQVDRLIVSTPGLAEAYSGWHKDIQILELKLPPVWWSNLKVTRTEHKKPRVGWAGGSSHLGDLELIADVVKDLADEVDWIFFGMCPAKLRPYVKEFHSGVPIHMYPQKLATLDLDLAVAPLENNEFNDCKSNLRLLEYGSCGYPVICSNTRAFVESKLPVQPIKNRYKDWVEAIKSHISDNQYRLQKAKDLQNAVFKNHMLDKAKLNNWLKHWCL
jgi:glycosyltransferase involved in cell wall biosynthesis